MTWLKKLMWHITHKLLPLFVKLFSKIGGTLHLLYRAIIVSGYEMLHTIFALSHQMF